MVEQQQSTLSRSSAPHATQQSDIQTTAQNLLHHFIALSRTVGGTHRPSRSIKRSSGRRASMSPCSCVSCGCACEGGCEGRWVGIQQGGLTGCGAAAVVGGALGAEAAGVVDLGAGAAGIVNLGAGAAGVVVVVVMDGGVVGAGGGGAPVLPAGGGGRPPRRSLKSWSF